VDALLVLGDADCARDLAAELAQARDPLLLALGLDAGAIAPVLDVPVLVPSTKAFPFSPSGGWYEGLGHDAGALVTGALEALPSAGVARQAEVDALHTRARDALASAQADLWTSEQRGFAGARVLERQFTIINRGSIQKRPK
jgi:hypothetical protein